MNKQANFLNDKVLLNVLSNSKENSKAIYEATEGHVVLGLLSKNYSNVESAVQDMKEHAELVDNAISVGLGAGDPNQWKMVAEISQQIQPQHVNQVFTGIGYTRALLGQNDTIVNGLISPSGVVGQVVVSTGPSSSKAEPAIVPVVTAIKMLKDMGCSSVKFFPMKGLSRRDEFIEVCKACAQEDFILEPTGGIDLNNFEEILTIAFANGVKKVVPHVYTSIIDPQSGDTKVEDVKALYEIMKKF